MRPKKDTRTTATSVIINDPTLWTTPGKELVDLAKTASAPELWTPKDNNTVVVIPKVPYKRPSAPPPRRRTDTERSSTSVPKFTPDIVSQYPYHRPIPVKRSLLPEFDSAAKVAKMSEYDDDSSSDSDDGEIVR